ncbi:YjeF-like protein [Angomonas deanei]|nr:YjeF-like protein [Angomonas deanei]|eukprot:EPY25765.1 YjeF-like protein [Angomonas deanei]
MADHTATFICLKPGLLTGAARRYVGQLHYNTLGLSQWMLDPTRIEAAVCHRISAASLPLYFNTATRSPCAHKGSNGRVLLIGGEVGYGGAILMSAEAALAAGAGLVRVFTQGEHVTPLLVRTPEVMVTTAPEASSEAFSDRLQEALSWCSVLAVGPGLGQGAFGRETMKAVLHHASVNPTKMVVFDADALNLLATLQTEGTSLPTLPSSIITPHPGEAARLLECSVKKVERDRLQSAQKLSALLGGACILKGPGSIVHSQPDKKMTIVDAGNAGMATGGMGDVLTGVIAGLAGQSLFPTLDTLTCAGTLVHSTAADMAVETVEGAGTRGLRATEIIPYVKHCTNL